MYQSLSSIPSRRWPRKPGCQMCCGIFRLRRLAERRCWRPETSKIGTQQSAGTLELGTEDTDEQSRKLVMHPLAVGSSASADHATAAKDHARGFWVAVIRRAAAFWTGCNIVCDLLWCSRQRRQESTRNVNEWTSVFISLSSLILLKQYYIFFFTIFSDLRWMKLDLMLLPYDWYRKGGLKENHCA